MRSRLHEGMTRTQSPPRSGSPLRVAALITLCAATLLALGWAVFSPLGGTGEHQAQAQAQPSGTQEGSGGVQEEVPEKAYAAYEYKNPMDISRVAQSKTEDTGQTENGDGNGNDGVNDAEGSGGNGAYDEDPNQATENNKTKELNGDAATPQEDNGPSGTVTGQQQQTLEASPPAPRTPDTGGVTPAVANCEGLQGMQKLICEDAQGSAQPGGSGEIESDRDGGSGRSGAGETTDTFRNGGPAPGK